MKVRLAAGLFTCAMLFSQAASSPAQVVGSNASARPESLPLAPGDLIHVSVFDVPEYDKHVRITDAGSITLPLIGEQKLAGLIPAQAERMVEMSLARGHFIEHAQVMIDVEQYAGADVAVIGQVEHPGNYTLAVPRNVMDVISLAGGLTPAADTHVTVQRHNGQHEMLEASLVNDPTIAMANAPLVYPGDRVIVPKAGIVYVMGDVVHPGGYVMSNDAQLTVMQAIALAAGTTKTASEAHVRLVRGSMQGPIETPVCLKCLEVGSQPDIPLQAADVVYVPFSTGKNIMLGASAILSSTSGAAIYAAH